MNDIYDNNPVKKAIYTKYTNIFSLDPKLRLKNK